MKRFLYNILLFVVPAYALLAIGDYFFSRRAQQSNFFHIENWYDLMHGNIEADIIVMGNSRAFVQIAPHILDSVLGSSSYNLAIDGSSINRQIRKYNVFRQYNRKPKLIIQNIDHITLNYVTGYEREQFFPYFWNKHIREEFMTTEPFSFWEKCLPLYRYYRNLKRRELWGLLTSTDRQLEKGYQGKDKPWDGTAFSHIDTVYYRVNDEAVKMFDQYLAQAKAEGIQVVFVHTPLYIGATRKLDCPQAMQQQYQNFADKYDIPILDYRFMKICYDTTYFYNAMHVNRLGAEIFSDSLANDIKKLKMHRILQN